MIINTLPRFLFKRAFALGLMAILTACGGGSGDSAESPSPTSSSKSSLAAVSNSSISLVSSSALGLSSSFSSSSSKSSAISVSSSLPSSSNSSGISSSKASEAKPYLMGGAIQGIDLNIEGQVSTLAGSAHADGVGAAARFNNPMSVTSDGTYLYVADMHNRSIRKIVIATGAVSTLAGGDKFSYPYALTSDGANLYVVDIGTDSIRKVVIATGEVSIFAGGSSGNADGLGEAASFNDPEAITSDGTYLYVADTANNSIRKIVIATGAVSTITGLVRTDNMSVPTSFSRPSGITTDGVNLYVADTGNNIVRKIDLATSEVSTIAGGNTGNSNGLGSAASFSGVRGIAVSGTNLYVMDALNTSIRKIDIATRAVTTLADNIGASYSRGIAVAGDNLYIADTSANLIRKVAVTTGAVSDFAGKAPGEDGTAQAATFSDPRAVTTDGTHLYTAESSGNIRKTVIATGVVTSLAKMPSTPNGITTDGTYLYATDSWGHCVRKIVIATGEINILAGSVSSNGNADGVGAQATFSEPYGITTDGTNLYVSDVGNNNIRKIVIATGAVSTLAGLTFASYHADEHIDGVGAAARFTHPFGITTDGTNLYTTDLFGNSIRKILIATAEVTTFAGGEGSNTSIDGIGTAATFAAPEGISTDGSYLYVTGNDNSIRKIEIATAKVSTLIYGTTGRTDGTALNQPTGITTDGHSLFVTDSGNNTIRKID